jgi:hypothetical protein
LHDAIIEFLKSFIFTFETVARNEKSIGAIKSFASPGCPFLDSKPLHRFPYSFLAMAIFDKLTTAAKDFFIEPEDKPAAPATPPTTQFGAAQAAPNVAPTPQPSGAAVNQPEQRHVDHIAGLLAGDGKDFGAYMKMVKSMAAAGMSGPLLYQTAFNAFSAVNGGTVPGLLNSATQFEQALQADREKVLARHREKMGEANLPGAAPSAVVQLAAQEKKLSDELAELTKQLQAKQQQLQQTQQQLAEERQKTQSALTSYELANATAMADLRAHHKAAETFLTDAK